MGTHVRGCAANIQMPPNRGGAVLHLVDQCGAIDVQLRPMIPRFGRGLPSELTTSPQRVQLVHRCPEHRLELVAFELLQVFVPRAMLAILALELSVEARAVRWPVQQEHSMPLEQCAHFGRVVCLGAIEAIDERRPMVEVDVQTLAGRNNTLHSKQRVK